METRPAILKLWERWKALTPQQKDETIHNMLLRVGDGLDPLDPLYFDDCVADMEYALTIFERSMTQAEEEREEV
jgi:hypothetical protein